jgi:Ca2+-dependent lipid-binding protein
VIFKVGNITKKSKIIKKSLNPVWNETFELSLTPECLKGDATLFIECWDHDTITNDDFMGALSISLKKLSNDFTYQFSEKLLKTESGSLEFEIRPQNFKYLEYGSLVVDSKLIKDKLVQSSKFQNCGQNAINYMAKVLSNSYLLKEKYLTTSWVDSITVQKELYESLDLDGDLDAFLLSVASQESE